MVRRGTEVVREVHGTKCEDLVSALALTVALSLDTDHPNAPPSKPKSSSELTTGAPIRAKFGPKPVTATQGRASAPISTARERAGVNQERRSAMGITTELLSGVMPNTLYGLSLFGEIWWGAGLPALGARGSVLQAASQFARNGEGAYSVLIAARGEVCLRLLRISGAALVSPCAGALLGSLEGTGIRDARTMRSDEGLWAELIAGLHVSTSSMLGGAFFELSLGPALTLTRYGYRLRGRPETPYVSKDIGFRSALGFGFGIP